jgi:hypothetical protein
MPDWMFLKMIINENGSIKEFVVKADRLLGL